MDIDLRFYGSDLCSRDEIWILEHNIITPGEITAAPRINIDYAGEARLWPWRFYIEEGGYV